MLTIGDFATFNNPSDYLYIENDQLKVTINPKGAELKRLVYKKTEQQLLWDNKEGFWERTSPNLFPYVGRANNGEYNYAGKTYKMPLHGLSPYYEFSIVEHSETKITLQQNACEETLTYYPFDFTFNVTFELVDNKLDVRYEIVNNDQKEMIYSIGGHPGFLLNWNEGDKVEDYSIKFSEKETVNRRKVDPEALALAADFEEKFFDNEDTLPLKDELFAIDALIFHDLKSDNLSIIHNQTEQKITVNITNFPDLGLWNQATANFVCIEPWFGYGDPVDHSGNLEDKTGVTRLSSSQSQSHDYSITVEL